MRFLAGPSTHTFLRLAQFAQAQAPGAATVPPDIVQDVMRTQRTAWEDGIIRAVDDASMAGNARTMVCGCRNIRGKGPNAAATFQVTLAEVTILGIVSSWKSWQSMRFLV
jgi:hypothetical protein